MDPGLQPALITAFAAVAGSMVGGLASFATTIVKSCMPNSSNQTQVSGENCCGPTPPAGAGMNRAISSYACPLRGCLRTRKMRVSGHRLDGKSGTERRFSLHFHESGLGIAIAPVTHHVARNFSRIPCNDEYQDR